MNEIREGGTNKSSLAIALTIKGLGHSRARKNRHILGIFFYLNNGINSNSVILLKINF